MPDLPTLLLFGIFLVIMLGVILLIRRFSSHKQTANQWQRTVGNQLGVHPLVAGGQSNVIPGSDPESRKYLSHLDPLRQPADREDDKSKSGMTDPSNNEQRSASWRTNHELVSNQTVVDSRAIESEYHARMERATADFEKSLDETLKGLQAGLLQNMNQVQKTHGQFLTNLEEMASTEQKNSSQHVATKINELLLNFEQNLTGFLSSSEQKSLEAINLEVRSARQLIDGYKAQQLAIVDENIVSVLEKTLELVLKEKLTLKNQVDLVYDALERAKVEKFFV